MRKINDIVSARDRIEIYRKTAIKVIRGIIKSFFWGERKFPIFIGKHVDLSHTEKIFCKKNVKFEDYSEIQGLSLHGLRFGQNVTIGRYTAIRPSSYYGVGKIGFGLTIGENSSIGPFSFVGCSGQISIGKNVMIGPRVSLFAENHNFSNTTVPIKKQGVNNKGIIIEDNCWIGSGVIILDGVTIGHGTVIGAGTIVTKNVPANSIIFDKREKLIRNR